MFFSMASYNENVSFTRQALTINHFYFLKAFPWDFTGKMKCLQKQNNICSNEF